MGSIRFKKEYFKGLLHNNQFVVLACVFGVSFVLQLFMFPKTGDDFFWGSDLGIDQLHKLFISHNARLFSNTLNILLLRCLPLKALFNAAVITIIVYFLVKLCFSKANIYIYILAVTLVVLLGSETFIEVIAWQSGFVNYALSAAFDLGFIYFAFDFLKKPEKYANLKTAGLIVAITLPAQFIVETSTFFVVILALGTNLLYFKRTKRFSVPLIVWFAVAFISAVVSVCLLKFYVQVDFRPTDSLETILVNTPIKQQVLFIFYVFQYLVLDNLFIFLSLSALIVIFVFRDNAKFYKKLILIATPVVFSSLLVVNAIRHPAYKRDDLMGTLFDKLIVGGLMISFLAAIAVFMYCLCKIKSKSIKNKLLAFGAMYVIHIIPIIVVQYASYRVFFLNYLLLSLIIIHFASYMYKEGMIKIPLSRIKLCLIPVFLITAVYLFVYCYSSREFYTRQKYILNEAAKGSTNIQVHELAFGKYLHSLISDTYYEITYKHYLKINENTTLEVLPAKPIFK
ncbi:MAG: DUF6056 family protein [Oscillospiraceae bacterium]|jgi:hypothetical protein|nr:DUF6056 family protein [Oscillospiraceae bacterium]